MLRTVAGTQRAAGRMLAATQLGEPGRLRGQQPLRQQRPDAEEQHGQQCRLQPSATVNCMCCYRHRSVSMGDCEKNSLLLRLLQTSVVRQGVARLRSAATTRQLYAAQLNHGALPAASDTLGIAQNAGGSVALDIFTTSESRRDYCQARQDAPCPRSRPTSSVLMR